MEAYALKQWVRETGTLHLPFGSLRGDRAKIVSDFQNAAAQGIFIDLQHGPFSEEHLVDFCVWAKMENIPVILRIRAPEECYLIGRYLDFGASGIVVPFVETPETAHAAVRAFYYPSQGVRSWGPGRATWAKEVGRVAYPSWWNASGLLMLQLETVDAIRRCRELAVPGVDVLVFGGADLALSLAATEAPSWPDEDSCREHVAAAVRDLPVRVARSLFPFGKVL